MPIQTATCGAARALDRGGFDDAILPLQGSLMRLALSLTHDGGDARDLVQDALERALREWTRFTPGTNARAWVSAILSRLFIDRWRRRRRQPRLVDLAHIEATCAGALCGGGTAGWGAAPDAAAVPLAPWEIVSEAELSAAIAKLPPRLRAVYDLTRTGHQSYLDISVALGVPVSTVGTRLLRARRHLRATLERQLAARGGQRETLRAASPTILVPAPSAGWTPTLQAGPGPSRAANKRSNSTPARTRGLPATAPAPRAPVSSSFSALG